MESTHKTLLRLFACLLFAGFLHCGRAYAQPMGTDAGQESGLIIGVAHADTSDDKQMDGQHNLRLDTWLYNDSPVPQVVDWRTRRVRSKSTTLNNSQHDFYGTFIIEPGEIILMKSYYYFKSGFPKDYWFSVRDGNQTVHATRVIPMQSNRGQFSKLSPIIQQRLIDAFLDHPDFLWWYRKY